MGAGIREAPPSAVAQKRSSREFSAMLTQRTGILLPREKRISEATVSASTAAGQVRAMRRAASARVSVRC